MTHARHVRGKDNFKSTDTIRAREATDPELHLSTPDSTFQYQMRPEEIRLNTAEVRLSSESAVFRSQLRAKPRATERRDKAQGQRERGENETERASRDPPALG